MSFMLYIPTRTLFGRGELNNLHKLPMPGKKAMLVISNGKATRTNGYLARTEEQLREANVEWSVFDKVEPNPLKSTVMEGGAFARENDCDFIVALGGGSVMDAAKGIAIVAANDGDLWDYVQMGTGGKKPFERRPLPIVAITTTAGTGSEIDAGGVITNAETNEKTAVLGEELFPVIAVVDAELMTSVPPLFTAYQGFDALFHSVEGYIANKANLYSDMVGSTAIRNVSEFLPIAVRDGKNLEARDRVAFGSYLSGIEMSVGSVSSQHSLEHAMSAFHQELPHGAGLIMLSCAYFNFFIKKRVCDERFIELAHLMGMPEAEKPEDFITALMELQRACGVADLKMSDFGITPEEFEKMAANAQDAMSFCFSCDRYPLTKTDCVEIYKAAFK
ncbi:MAG: iron-containing alcohol dehydrogenase [Cloacibacillus sp.]